MKLNERRFDQAKFLVANAAERGLAPEQAYGHVILDALRRFVNRTFNRDDLFSALWGAATAMYTEVPMPVDIVVDAIEDLNAGEINVAEAEVRLKDQFEKKVKEDHALHRDGSVPGTGGDRGPDGGPGSDPREG
jgi:hypothetical protein